MPLYSLMQKVDKPVRFTLPISDPHLDPDVGTVTVPVTMTVAGPALAMPEDLTAMLTNAITGQVGLSWTFVPTMISSTL